MAGLRVYYAALVCTLMLNRCKAVVEGRNTPLTHPMPELLITPFQPEEASTHPPSRFEMEVTRVARSREFPGADQFVDNWLAITEAVVDGGQYSVMAAERRF